MCVCVSVYSTENIVYFNFQIQFIFHLVKGNLKKNEQNLKKLTKKMFLNTLENTKKFNEESKCY